MKEKHFHLKDKEPEETVKFIKSILKKLEIETEERWVEVSEAGTYSLDLYIKDTAVYTSGKGVSKYLAMASAYGEFLEYLANGILLDIDKRADEINNEAKFVFSKDEKLCSAKEIMSHKSILIKRLLKANSLHTLKLQDQIKWFDKISYSKFSTTCQKDKYVCIPFKNIVNGEEEYFPSHLVRILFGSNGMSAGNTKEEALVEGISELIERYVQQEVILKNLRLPDFPTSYIKNYSSVWNMYNKIRNIKGYTILLKDASLGGIWPSAAIVIIDNNTGKYGVNFGAHPNLNIALERCFTEAFQGRKIKKFSTCTKLCFDKKTTNTWNSVLNNFTGTTGFYPATLFSEKPSFSFNPVNCRKKTNKGFLNFLIELLKKQKKSIFVRDNSYLGFPTYHTLIPQFADYKLLNQDRILMNNSKLEVKQHMLDVRTINKNNAKNIIKCLNYYLQLDQISSLKCYFPSFTTDLTVPCGFSKYGTYYFISMLYILRKDYNNALDTFMKIFNDVNRLNICDEDNKTRVLIMKLYLESRSNGLSHIKTLEILSNCFDKKYCEYLDNVLKDEKKVMVKQYPIILDMLDNECFKPQKKLNKIYEKMIKMM